MQLFIEFLPKQNIFFPSWAAGRIFWPGGRRLEINMPARPGDQAAGRCTVNTTSRPAGPIYLITAIDQAVQARTSSSQNFEGMLKPAVRRPGRDGPPRPREERRSEKNVAAAPPRRAVPGHAQAGRAMLKPTERRRGLGTGLDGHTYRRAPARSGHSMPGSPSS